jgi:hypothetical protein
MPIFSIIDWSKVWDLYELWYASLGALIGSGVALIIAHFDGKRRTKRERATAKQALMERLEFNGTRITQMLGQFSSGVEVPNYPLDTTGIIVWLTLSYDVLNGELIKDINWHRYQLDHLNTKLHTYYLLIAANNPFAPDASAYIRARESEARRSICTHLKETSEAVCPLIRRLEQQ